MKGKNSFNDEETCFFIFLLLSSKGILHETSFKHSEKMFTLCEESSSIWKAKGNSARVFPGNQLRRELYWRRENLLGARVFHLFCRFYWITSLWYSGAYFPSLSLGALSIFGPLSGSTFYAAPNGIIWQTTLGNGIGLIYISSVPTFCTCQTRYLCVQAEK